MPRGFPAGWAAQQIIEAVGPDSNVTRLIRDRDGIYGASCSITWWCSASVTSSITRIVPT